MHTLFIGHSYIDVTFVTDTFPTGDDKALGRDYAFGIGGNAMVAAFTCAKLGIGPDLLIPIANDWLGDMMLQRCAKAGIRVHPRGIGKSSLSLVMPNNGKRAILRCRDMNFTEPFPRFSLSGCKALHLDGHQMEAARYYAEKCREKGILTSLDGGALRPGTEELLKHIDVAVVSTRFCEQLKATPEETLGWLQQFGVKVAGVTLGEDGIIYTVGPDRFHMPALPVPINQVVDSTGAGDIFHGAYIYHYLQNPHETWHAHFAFARAASALAIQHLGTEASIPALGDIEALASLHPADQAPLAA